MTTIKIHATLHKAKQAKSMFMADLERLEERYGADFYCDDSCVMTGWQFKYLDDEGYERFLD